MDSNISKPREIRVFLSSTFKDMEAERNHLVKHVFPRIRAACLARQVGFTEIDLRWGVTEEESKNGATVEICLKEIERCRDFPPFFIGFLGERYGWIPSEGELTAYWARHEDSPYATSIRNAIRRGISVTELEMELAVLGEGAAEKLRGHALFLLRDRTLTDSLYQNETGKAPDLDDSRYYDPGGDKLAKLKERLRASPFLGLDGYTSIEQFGQAIEQHLVDQINRHFPAENIPDSHQLGNVAHSAFRNQRLQNFLPRDDVRQALVSAIEDRRTTPDLATVLIAGPSGQGKSAIMADLACHLESLPGYRVIDHYIGADGDTSLDGWVHRILRTLHTDIADEDLSIPESPEERTTVLPDWLSMAASCKQCRYVLILDGLDQLDDQGRDIRMLRHSHIGPAATVIASAADGTQARESAVGLGFDIHVVPPFDDLQRERMITDTLARYRKKMRPELVCKFAAAPPTGSPLFLMLALEKLRLDAKHESLDADVDDILAQPDAKKLFLTKFLRDEDYGRPGQLTLALEFMALLAASRNGLTEYELSELLAMPSDPKSEETGRPLLPQIYLSQLIAVFQPFLISKQGNRAPMHSMLGKAALDGYGNHDVRKKIASYFSTQQLRTSDGRRNDRMLREYPWQLMMMGDHIALKNFLLNSDSFRVMADRYALIDGHLSVNSYRFDLALYWKWLRKCGIDVQSEFKHAIDNERSALSKVDADTEGKECTLDIERLLVDQYASELNSVLLSIGENPIEIDGQEHATVHDAFKELDKIEQLFWEAVGTFEAQEAINKLLSRNMDIPKSLSDGLISGQKTINQEKDHLRNFIEKYTPGAVNWDQFTKKSATGVLINWIPLAQAHFILSDFERSAAIYSDVISRIEFDQNSTGELGRYHFEYSKVLFFGNRLEECFTQGVKALQIYDEYYPVGNGEIHQVIKHLFALALSLPLCEANAQRIMQLFRFSSKHACDVAHYSENLKLALVATTYAEKGMLSSEDTKQLGELGTASFKICIGTLHEQGGSREEIKILAALALPLYRTCFGKESSETMWIEKIANM